MQKKLALGLGLLVAVTLWWGGGRGASGAGLPSQALPQLGGGETSLAECGASKCLTVVLAPWCGYCRSATPMLLRLREEAAARGALVRFVIGQDNPEGLREYASVFGRGTVLDERNVIKPRGVPHFYLSDRSGAVIKTMAGAPPTEDAKLVADYFGL